MRMLPLGLALAAIACVSLVAAGPVMPLVPGGGAPPPSAAAGDVPVSAPEGAAPAPRAPPGPLRVAGASREFTTTMTADGFQHARIGGSVPLTVRWWNVDQRVHSVMSDEGAFPGAAAIPPYGDFTFTFQTPGEYAFHCRWHEDMRGVVVVE